VDSGRCLSPVLDRIANQVLENLHQHNVRGYQGWQRIGSHAGAALLNLRLEVQQRLR
jgi:hypothetical protein